MTRTIATYIQDEDIISIEITSVSHVVSVIVIVNVPALFYEKHATVYQITSGLTDNILDKSINVLAVICYDSNIDKSI